MRNEVYSWRVSTEIKTNLEREARLRGTSVSSLLETAVREWLNKSSLDTARDAEQRRLHEAAEECLGVLTGQRPRRSETARRSIRERLRRRYGR